MKKVIFLTFIYLLVFIQYSFANAKIAINKENNKIVLITSNSYNFQARDLIIFEEGELFEIYRLNELTASFNNTFSLFSLGNPTNVNIYNMFDGNLFTDLQIMTDDNKFTFEQAYSIAFNSNNKFLANGNGYREVRIWDIKNKKLINTLYGHKGNGVNSICFSNDNKTIISGDSDGEIKIWYFKKENEFINYNLCSLNGHNSSPIAKLIISNDNKLLASSSFDGTINIWDIKTGIKISSEKIESESKSYIDLNFSPDNKLLASSDNKGNIIIWDMKPFYEISSTKKEKYLQFLVKNTFNSNIAPNNQLLNDDIILSVDNNAFESSKDFIDKIKKQGNYILKINRNNKLINIFLNKKDGFNDFEFNIIGKEITFKKLFELNGYESIFFTSNSKYLISGGSDFNDETESKILIFNLSKKEALAKINIITKGENAGDWFIMTKDNMFDGSINGLKMLVNPNSANFKKGLLNNIFNEY